MMTKLLKTIIFVDIRGFTKLCDSGFTILTINEFLGEFRSLVEKCFENAQIKHLGDGSMILMEEKELDDILERIMRLRRDLQSLCNAFSKKKGIDLNLKLGFGLTKGDVIEIVEEHKSGNIVVKDYIGPKINLASRLCGLARPSGVIVHKESFPQMPRKFATKFKLVQIRNIHGLERYSEVRCFVEKTVELPNSLTEIRTMNIEVHVTGLCFHNGKLLLCRRASDRDIGAAKWAGPGGKVLPNYSFEDSLRDIFKREVGIEICDLKLIGSYFIESHRIPGLVYYCRISKGEPFDADKQNSEVCFFSREEITRVMPQLLPSMDFIKKGFEISQEFHKLTTKLRIVVSQECNLNCKFCHGENVIGDFPTQTQNIKDSLAKISNIMDLRGITITGGEPFTDTSIEKVLEICSYLQEIFPSVPVSIVTNGLNLTSELLENIKKSNIRLKISVYGTDSDDFQEYTGRRFDKYDKHIIEILKQIQSLQISYSLNVLLRHSFDRKLESFIDILDSHSLFPEKIKIIQMVSPRKETPEFQTEYMPLENSSCYEESYAFIIDKTFPHRQGIKYRNQNIELYKYPCHLKELCNDCFENWGATLLPNGSLQVCEKAMDNPKVRKVIDSLGIPMIIWQPKDL